MRLILVGCEYVGNTTLANAIDDWMDITIGARFSLIHEHWKIPHTSGHPDNTTPEEQAWLLASTPKFKEMHQRHSLYYHAHGWATPDVMMVGAAIEDAVYAPLFFGYGGKDEFQDREVVMHQWEATILAKSDETPVSISSLNPSTPIFQATCIISPATKIAAAGSAQRNPAIAPPIPAITTREEKASDLLCHALTSRSLERSRRADCTVYL